MKKLLLLTFLGLTLFFVNASSTLALECEDIPDVSKRIECLNNKIRDLQGQKRTLFSQIAVMDSQIRLTEFRITATQGEIAELALDIDTADKKIDTLEQALDGLTKILLNRIVVTYQVGRTQPFEILFSSTNASSFFSRLNYLRIAQAHDKEIIYQTQQAKSDYTNQKEIFEAKKKRAEVLKASLDRFTVQLAQEKSSKQALLEVTKNDEAIYQRLLSQTQAERAIVFGGGVESFIREVNQGDTIGSIASHSVSPGCSSGAHLHFEVHKDGNIQDPNSYLTKSVNYSYSYSDTSLYGAIYPSGDLPWPLNEPIIIHQGYGSHTFARTSGYYAGGVHTGIDMDSSSFTVKAVKAGKLYGGSINCTGINKGALYYTKIIHDGGLTTWYLHVAPN